MRQVELDLEEICKDRSSEKFYKENGLVSFLKNHKPKSLLKNLQPYLEHRKLKKLK